MFGLAPACATKARNYIFAATIFLSRARTLIFFSATVSREGSDTYFSRHRLFSEGSHTCFSPLMVSGTLKWAGLAGYSPVGTIPFRYQSYLLYGLPLSIRISSKDGPTLHLSILPIFGYSYVIEISCGSLKTNGGPRVHATNMESGPVKPDIHIIISYLRK